MGTELPTERLHRRPGAEVDADTGSDGDDGNSDAALSRWLPDADTGEQPGWLAAVRADPGRAGAIALGLVGVVAVLVTVFTLLRDAATRLSIPYTVHAAGGESWTDADAIHVAREGIATGLLSIPNRYMHSPNELVSLEDLDRAAALIAETCRAVSPETDFTAR